ncbi:MAG: type II toxin-antitoxin system PrlF family antitoxin [Burkholderiales bacterium]
MATAPQRYAGKVTRVGNSKGIRLDAAFFKAHPEFGGEVQATVLAEGQLLLSATTKGRTRGKTAETVDPVVVSFLGFLERQMRAQPERIRPLDAKLLDGIGELVKGVDVE